MSAIQIESFKQKYRGVDLELSDGKIVVLRNFLKLTKAERTRVAELFDELDEIRQELKLEAGQEFTSDDEIAFVESAGAVNTELLVAVAGSDREQLREELEGDPLVASSILSVWVSETQLGEANTSPN